MAPAHRGPHTALRAEAQTKANTTTAEFVLARLQWGKDDVGYSLHVSPAQYSVAPGVQLTDFLNYLGFVRSDHCGFTNARRCYTKWVEERFDLPKFVTALSAGFARLTRAQEELAGCGFNLPQPEGAAFFFGKQSSFSPNKARNLQVQLSGDGHTAMTVRSMKQTEDQNFLYRFTFLEAAREKGFVTHYRPKHPPLSDEMIGVFSYLGLKPFSDCPEFDFDGCHFRTLRYENNEDRIFDGNTEFAHRCFDAHATRFSKGVENLLASNAAVEEVNMAFLPIRKQDVRLDSAIRLRVASPKAASQASRGQKGATKLPELFDVAISFAGPERALAESLAQKIREAGYSVFYDDFYPEHLWGKNLTVFFDEIFRKKSRFCVMLVSQEYVKRKWTIHEAQSAQARALEEKGGEYILPIKVDGAELDGLLPTVGYLGIDRGIERISEVLISKLRS